MTDGIKGVHSTGRGGAGNIGTDDTLYTDGGLVREGVYGQSNHAEYSSGRGGAGNIVDTPTVKPANASEDVFPESSFRSGHQENFHTGRGGEGNVHKDKYGGHSTAQSQSAAHSHHESIGDKVKHLLHMDKDKKDEVVQK